MYNAGVTVVAAKGNENKDTTIYSMIKGISLDIGNVQAGYIKVRFKYSYIDEEKNIIL